MFGYYKEFKFVIIQRYCQFFYKENSVNRRIYHTVNKRSMLMKLNVLSNFKVNFDWTVELFYRSKMDSHLVYVIKKRNKGRKVSFKPKKRRFITVDSNFNRNETNNSNTSKRVDVMVNPNFPRINVHTKSPLNKLINLKKETDTQSSSRINDEITDDNNTSEEISCHKNSSEVIVHTCDDNGNYVLNIEEEADVTYIHSINANNDLSMNDYDNFMHKHYAQFPSSNNHEGVSSGS